MPSADASPTKRLTTRFSGPRESPAYTERFVTHPPKNIRWHTPLIQELQERGFFLFAAESGIKIGVLKKD
jgi:hypothetical protein